MLPGPLLNYSVVGRTLVPHFLGEHDHPWLRVLLEEHERFVGQPQRELDARLREPLPCESPRGTSSPSAWPYSRVWRNDEDRNCTAGDLPAGALIVRFRRRVDAAAVLRLVS